VLGVQRNRRQSQHPRGTRRVAASLTTRDKLPPTPLGTTVQYRSASFRKSELRAEDKVKSFIPSLGDSMKELNSYHIKISL